MGVSVSVLKFKFGSSITVIFVKHNGFPNDIGYGLLVLGG